jgi:hypothetical protein
MRVELDAFHPQTGARLNTSGPITTATRGSRTRRVDQAGEFSFELPAGDAAAQHLQHEARVRARGYLDGGSVELGAGIIKGRRVRVGRGAEVLEVEGLDQMAELAERVIPRLDLCDEVWEAPKRVLVIRDAAGDGVYSATDITSVVTDGNPATFATLTMDSVAWPDYLYVGTEWPALADQVALGTQLNSVPGTTYVDYYEGESESQEWRNFQAVTDGTSGGGAPFGQNGTVGWEMPAVWRQIGAEGETLFWHRLFVPSVILNPVDISAISTKVRKAKAADLQAILDHDHVADLNWSLDPDPAYQQATQRGTYLAVMDDTPLGAFGQIGNLHGEHFRGAIGAGGEKLLQWLGPMASAPSTGLRAIRAPDDPEAVAANDDVVLIRNATIDSESYEIWSRVQPFGAGQGDARITLAQLPDSVKAEIEALPGGYVVDRENNWITRGATEAQFGRKERQKHFKEVAGVDATAAADASAATQLAWATVAYMEQVKQEFVVYDADVVKVPLGKALDPGSTLHAVFRATREEWDEAGNEVVCVLVDVDTYAAGQPLYILEVREGWDARGISPTGLKFASSDRWPRTNDDVVLELARQQLMLHAHPQPLSGGVIRPLKSEAGI